MSEATVKHCEQCRAEYRTRRPDRAKYCSFCAAANGILHFKFKQVKCFACRQAFCPATAKDVLCSTCDNGINFCREVVSGKCHYCDAASVTLADKEIPVCFRCWKSPEVRPRLVTTLAKKRAARIAATQTAD